MGSPRESSCQGLCWLPGPANGTTKLLPGGIPEFFVSRGETTTVARLAVTLDPL